jgi:hypothetical protein
MAGITNRSMEEEQENQERVEERKEEVSHQEQSDRAKQHASPEELGKVSDTGYLLDTGQGRV